MILFGVNFVSSFSWHTDTIDATDYLVFVAEFNSVDLEWVVWVFSHSS